MFQLYYTESGAGFPLIFLHGNGENSNYFVHQIDYFSPHYRVIAVDTRGHGKSPRGEAPFTLTQFAEDLKGFLDGLGIQKAHILGFSDGGNIALLFALNYPEMVERLILNGANLTPSGVKEYVQIPNCISYGILSLLTPFSRAAAVKKEMLALMIREPRIQAAELWKLTMPVLVIVGKKDVIKEAHSREIAFSIPNARLCVIEGDHYIAGKNSRVFNLEVSEFLKM